MCSCNKGCKVAYSSLISQIKNDAIANSIVESAKEIKNLIGESKSNPIDMNQTTSTKSI